MGRPDRAQISISLHWYTFGDALHAAVGGFFRVFVTHGNLRDSVAIAASLLLIVLASVLLGTALPFALVRAGIDPAHAGSSIQVSCWKTAMGHV